VTDLPEAEDGVIRKRRWKQHRQCMADVVERWDSSRFIARWKDGHTGLAERPKVAGAQAVAAGSNNDDGWQRRPRSEERNGASQGGFRKKRSSTDCVDRRESVKANVDKAVSSVMPFGAAQIWEVQDESPGWKGFKDEAC